MIADDATIARLRAKLKDRDLTPEEEVAILLELIEWLKSDFNITTKNSK